MILRKSITSIRGSANRAGGALAGGVNEFLRVFLISLKFILFPLTNKFEYVIIQVYQVRCKKTKSESEIKTMAEIKPDMDFFQSLWNADGSNKPLPEQAEEPVQPELPEEIIVEGENEVGTVIEYKGQRWEVTRSEYYSAQDQAEDAQGGMGSLTIGWHSWLRKLEAAKQDMNLQRELWEKSGRVQYNEYVAFRGNAAFSEEQARLEAERTADQFKLTIETRPVQRQALIDGFMAEWKENHEG